MNESIQPGEIGTLLDRAVELHRTGRVNEARKSYQKVLERDPTQTDALHFLGLLAYARGELQAAIEHILKALKSDPRNASAQNNLGNILLESGDFDLAAEAYTRAIEAAPENPDPRANLAICRRAKQDINGALEEFTAALRCDPNHREALFNLANFFLGSGVLDAGIKVLEDLTRRHPNFAPGLRMLGQCLVSSGRGDEAAELFGRWLQNEPDNPVAQHHYAATTGEAVPERCADAYVEQVFDAFAASFDSILAKLDYHAPELTNRALAQRLGDADGTLNILDAGCGTGLCGPLLRPRAARLIGVDLSAGMLGKARLRGVYDELEKAEMTTWLQAHPGQFDAIVSADAMNYFGKLAEIVAALFASLRPGGELVFTLEQLANHSEDAFVLQGHGRYAHAPDPVRAQLADAGFRDIEIAVATLRKEAAQAVQGLVVAARKP